jgi:hypothetical protein
VPLKSKRQPASGWDGAAALGHCEAQSASTMKQNTERRRKVIDCTGLTESGDLKEGHQGIFKGIAKT